jgi:predicted component of type VI protein secretion system
VIVLSVIPQAVLRLEFLNAEGINPKHEKGANPFRERIY